MATDVLKALLENELLTDDVKKSIETAFTAIIEEQKSIAEATAIKEAAIALNEALEEKTANIEATVRTELASKFVAERDELITSLDETLTALVASEVELLKEDISDFRDLEVEAIAKLEDEKQELAEQFAEQKKAFIIKIDEFVETHLATEIEELTEDIQTIKMNTAGMQMFEMVQGMYEDSFADKDEHVKSVKEKLAEMSSEKEAAEARTLELEEQVAGLTRLKALEETLAPLSGKRKAVMESILEGYGPENFGVVYKKMITRVMDTVSADADIKVVESKEVVEEISETVDVVDGNHRLEESEVIEESVEDLSAAQRTRKLAGLSK